ncbi:unnamed protein product [Coffea canephora]|uniref:Uncharacterized protein n=1 Tax=Coffea canephora TaxID=49390 RepID=A0A068V5T4_COFCA|nr:unnamed protein product [Coffea canephora]
MSGADLSRCNLIKQSEEVNDLQRLHTLRQSATRSAGSLSRMYITTSSGSCATTLSLPRNDNALIILLKTRAMHAKHHRRTM